jgi:DNA polymerase-2
VAKSDGTLTSDNTTLQGYLLTRQWRDLSDGVDLSFWAATDRGPLRLHVPAQKSVCFVARGQTLPLPPGAERTPLSLSIPGGPEVDGIYTRRQSQMADLHRHYGTQGKLHESDIKPHDRYLMERFICAGFEATGALTTRDGYVAMQNPRLTPVTWLPTLKLASIDIETQGLTGTLYSIAIHCGDEAVVLILADEPVPDDGSFTCRSFATEKELLNGFFECLGALDPDVLIGWNVINFDLDFIARKCESLGLRLSLGRGDDESAILRPGASQMRIARIPGRAVLDGVDTLRAAFWTFESFSLENVAQQLLGHGKTIESSDRVAQIDHYYRHDKAALARYNIVDCRLVTEIFNRAQLLPFALQRAQMTGLPLDKTGGAVQTFDNLYLPRLHRKGYVAPSFSPEAGGHSPGGYVLDSQPGLYRNVIVLDFKSLYPSIIRTFLIDPLGLALGGEDGVPGFEGAVFSRTEHILPQMVESLWTQRDEAKAGKNAALSQAIKIIMNSLYGVLGTDNCRFHHHQLASSITRRGHEIILQSRQQIEAAGFEVIYGDTDSLFVLLGEEMDNDAVRATGERLQRELNQYWSATLRRQYDVESHLEVEYETHYQRFVMPTVRGSDSGSKKRYAGLVSAGSSTELIFKGLEAVRTDWTPLAREFQRQLYQKVFNDEPVEAFIRHTAEAVLSGQVDSELVYRKRLRRKLSEYVRNVPPHVQAARKHSNPQHWISYLITVNGPEPSDERVSPIDYQHYIDKQLEPAADGILYFLDTSFQEINSAQISLF